MGNSTYWTLHSEGKCLEIKLFLIYFCLKLEQVFITWYFTISRKNSLSKAVKYFCFKLCYGQYKTRVSRQWWLDQWHQINEDLDFPEHLFHLPEAVMSRNAGWQDSMHFMNTHHNLLQIWIMYIFYWLFSKEDT